MPPKIEAITDEGSAPTVFISYTHDSPAHSRRVLELSNWLRGEGFDCDIDQYHANQDWPAWMERKIEYSDFVLVICTPIYLRRWRNNERPGVGLGAQWESLLTRQHLYLAPGFNTNCSGTFRGGTRFEYSDTTDERYSGHRARWNRVRPC